METERRNPMRVIAPAALVVFALALLLVVVTSGGGGSDESAGGRSAEKERDLGAEPKQKAKKRNADKLPEDKYIVKKGDSFGSIAEKTGVPVDKLQELNPEVDPQALVTGQSIKLRE